MINYEDEILIGEILKALVSYVNASNSFDTESVWSARESLTEKLLFLIDSRVTESRDRTE